MIRGLIIFIILFTFNCTSLFSQENQDVVVVSYFKCSLDKMEEVTKKTNEEAKPILDRLVDEGKLLSWGALQHYWGDEWNFIIYYNAENLAEFESASNEYFDALMKSNPEAMSEWTELCHEHKDNIYSNVTSYSGDN